MTYDYLIIGGGITGVTVARLLRAAGVRRLAVLEAAEAPGGLCRTRQVGPHVLDVGGGHFLCTKFPEVEQFIFRHLPRAEFGRFERVSRVVLDGQEIDYPVEGNLWQLPAARCAEYLVSVVQNGEARGLPAPADFAAWIRWKLGERIAERYMLPYNRKIWGVPAEEMDIDWLHKIPRLDVREIVTACLERQSDRKHLPSHAVFYYPRSGGFQQVFDAIAGPVRDLILTGVPVTSVERTAGGLTVNGRFHARAVINTAPWPTLVEAPIFPEPVRSAIRRLRHNELVVSLHAASYDTDAHWLYEPDMAAPHHRTFFIHNFAPHSASDGWYRETNRQRWTAGAGELYAEINRHAYPIPTVGWAAAIDTVLRHCAPLGLHGLGRWGQWQYFNSDVCIREAMLLADRLGHPAWRTLLEPALPRAVRPRQVRRRRIATAPAGLPAYACSK